MQEQDLDFKAALELVEKDLVNYPPTLQPKHIAKYLGISLSLAYKLFHSGELPTVNLPNSKFLVVPKSVFIRWYATRLSNEHLESPMRKDV